ncbi:acyltransferase [Ferrimicrobium sp.]|uniref:acyltransferase family protein n=1 Tax=Ferrimicrobium sp. TaxID=2926050 RepID=UPI00261C5FC8|nr:acyltransferase [Ferrimicrobium sp.]
MTTVLAPLGSDQPETEIRSTRPQHLPRLSALRIFAAVGVVLCHVGYYFTSVRVLRKAEVYGYGGVEFFFLLSGFVLTWAWLYRRPAVRHFWWRRVAKLYPITLGLTVFAYLALPQYERIPGTRGKVLELMLLQAWWPKERVYFGGNGVSWSLSCEIFFYLAFPFVLAGVKRLHERGFWVLAAVTVTVLIVAPTLATGVGVAAATRYWLFFVFPPYQFGFFLIGMLIARAVGMGLRMPKPSLVFVVALVWLTALVGWGASYSLDHAHGLSRPLVLLVALPAFISLLAAAVSKDLRHEASFLANPKLTYLGIISFELYLVHKPLFLLARPLGVWKNSGGLDGALTFLGFLAVALLAASLMHHLLQVPIERVLVRPHHPLRCLRRLCWHSWIMVYAWVLGVVIARQSGNLQSKERGPLLWQEGVPLDGGPVQGCHDASH